MKNKSAIFCNTATVRKTYKTESKQILTQGWVPHDMCMIQNDNQNKNPRLNGPFSNHWIHRYEFPGVTKCLLPITKT